MVVDPAHQAQKLLQLQERLTRSQWRGKKKTGAGLLARVGLVSLKFGTRKKSSTHFCFFFPIVI